jgi:hypothetical protein
MLVIDTDWNDTNSTAHNAETGIDESFRQSEADGAYTFNIEDMDKFADGKLNKEQFLARAKWTPRF